MSYLPFSRIEGKWNSPVYSVGGGTSLIGFDFGRLRGKGILVGVNKSAWLYGLDVMVTLDQHFAKEHREDIQAFVDDGGEAILAMPPSETGHKPIRGATYVHRRRNEGLSDDPTSLYGVNSGYAALGVAYLRRAPSVALLGYDMQYGKDGRTHHHDGYPWHNKASHRMMDKWATNFEMAAQQCATTGVEVINFVGAPDSKITAFPKASLGDL